MKLEENLQDGSCKVQYCRTHCGHKYELAHIRIPEKVRIDIATQLQAGVSLNKIMDNIRDTSMPTGIKREHLIVKQDVRNIKRVLNLQNIEKHSNDQTSVALWVEEARKQEYNPVLVFKPQGVEDAVVGNTDNIAKDSFLLAIQTQLQREIMVRYASSGGVICMDATHGTNVYDFLLITILVIDSHGEGIPVAWAITDREDACTLVQFLKPLFERVGGLKPDVFMSDDAEQYYSAWCDVFSFRPKKLLCIWHVERAWKKAVHEHVKGAQNKLEVYHMLQVLKAETNVVDFQLLFSQAMSHFEGNFPKMYEYMKNTYSFRTSQWATCYRRNAQINTNMFAEAFHRVLKIDYLEHKQNRRIDHLLYVLFKINRDTFFNILRKEEVGKRSHRIQEIQRRHSAAMEMLGNEIKPDGKDSWLVQSESIPDHYYSVNKMACSSRCGCHLTCDTCNICVHTFMCNCVDAIQHNTICKHIHLLGLKLNSHTDTECTTHTATCDIQHISNDVSLLTSSSGPGSLVESSTSKERLCEKIDELKDLVSKSSGIDLSEVNSHVSSAIAIVRSVEFQSFQAKKHPAPNANSITQEHFFSTRKRRKLERTGISKPDVDEHYSIRSQLSEMETTLCGICFNRDDDFDESIDIEWITCSECSLWVHKTCARRTSMSLESDVYFKCISCRVPTVSVLTSEK